MMMSKYLRKQTERKSLDIRFTDYPLDQERNTVPFPAIPARDNGSRDWSLAGK